MSIIIYKDAYEVFKIEEAMWFPSKLVILSYKIITKMEAAWIILSIQMLIPLIGYAFWYLKSQKAVSMEDSCVERSGGYKKASRFMWLLTAIAIVLAVFSMSAQHFGLSGIFGIANITIVIPLALTIKNVLTWAEASRKVNLTVTMVSCVILSIVLTGAMTCAGWFGKYPDETYTTTLPNESTNIWNIYYDPLPLKVEDLQDADYEHYSYEWPKRESFLLGLLSAANLFRSKLL